MDFESDEQRKAVMAKLRNERRIYPWLEEERSNNNCWQPSTNKRKLNTYKGKVRQINAIKVYSKHSKRNLKCLYCTRLFTTKAACNRHVKDAHPEGFNPNIHKLFVTCDKCGLKFPSEYKLNKHFRTHKR